jgi:hypothetical protein
LFARQIGAFTATSSGPIFSDLTMEVYFPVILPSCSNSPQSYNESVSIIWSEDCEDISSHLPGSPSNFALIVVTPALVSGKKSMFFRIRILMAKSLQAEYNSIRPLHNVTSSFIPNLLLIFIFSPFYSHLVHF